MQAYPIGWLHPDTDYIASFPPLNNLPTQYRITLRGAQRWFAQCGFEATSVTWLFPGETVRVDAPCLDCGDPVTVEMRDRRILWVAVAATTPVGKCPAVRKRKEKLMPFTHSVPRPVHIVLALGVLAVLGGGTPVASAATAPPCRVTNTVTDVEYAGQGDAPQTAIDAAASSETLKIKGICVGNYSIGKDLTLVGSRSRNSPPPPSTATLPVRSSPSRQVPSPSGT